MIVVAAMLGVCAAFVWPAERMDAAANSARGAGPVQSSGGAAPQYDPSLFQEMRWRHIGPFRAGRTVAAAGVPSQQNVFYVAANNGGVWRTTDFGQTWTRFLTTSRQGQSAR